MKVGKSVLKGAQEALTYAEATMNPDNPSFRSKKAQSTRDLSTIMCFAFRYTLGRRSCGPSFVQDYIKAHIDCLTSRDMEQMAREIVDYKAMYGHLGDPAIDEPDWLEFRDYLLSESGKNNPVML